MKRKQREIDIAYFDLLDELDEIEEIKVIESCDPDRSIAAMWYDAGSDMDRFVE